MLKLMNAVAGGKEYFEQDWARFVRVRLGKDPAKVSRELNAAVKWANVDAFPLYVVYAFVVTRGGFSELKRLELAEFFEKRVLRRPFPDAHHKHAFQVGVSCLYNDYFLLYEAAHPEDIVSDDTETVVSSDRLKGDFSSETPLKSEPEPLDFGSPHRADSRAGEHRKRKANHDLASEKTKLVKTEVERVVRVRLSGSVYLLNRDEARFFHQGLEDIIRKFSRLKREIQEFVTSSS